MEDKGDILGKYIGGGTRQYVHSSKMAENGIWGTDTELMAAAIFLNTFICIFTLSGAAQKWLNYMPRGQEESIEKNYLTNLHNHFDRVLEEDL